MREGGTAPALLNAANEVAVAAFLQGRIGFWDIQACNRETLARISAVALGSLAQVLDADRAARRHAEGWVQTRA
jgi:1-deoxy-D-xylulose-5-phosphate reductoisomerase